MVQEDVGRYLHGDISDVEDREQRGELGTVQIQVFLKPTKPGGSGIIPVNLNGVSGFTRRFWALPGCPEAHDGVKLRDKLT